MGLFVAALRGRGLGREVTRLILSWGFDVPGLHRIQLEVLACDSRAITCYMACGFRQERSPPWSRAIPGPLERPHPHGSAVARLCGRGKTRPSDLVVDQTVHGRSPGRSRHASDGRGLRWSRLARPGRSC